MCTRISYSSRRQSTSCAARPPAATRCCAGLKSTSRQNRASASRRSESSCMCGLKSICAMPCKITGRSEEHTSELQSRGHLVCRLLLEKKKQRSVHTRHLKREL